MMLDVEALRQMAEYSSVAVAIYMTITAIYGRDQNRIEAEAVRRLQMAEREAEDWRRLAMGAHDMRRLAPEIISGSLITHSISIRCAYCDVPFLDPRGSETIENADDSFRAMPRTLVCRSCYKRFVKPVPLGWSDHPLAHMMRTPTRQRPTPADGQARPSAAQTLSAGREAVRSLMRASDVIEAARTAIRRS